jgi:hypothetical protein
MCSYKLVEVAFDVWGIGSTIETHVQQVQHAARNGKGSRADISIHPPIAQGIRELLAVGHREAFAWIDSWHGMTEEDVRKYEDEMRTHMYGRPMIDKQARQAVGVGGCVSAPMTLVRAAWPCIRRNAKISKTAKRVAEAEAKGEVQPIHAPAGGGVLRRMSSGGTLRRFNS